MSQFAQKAELRLLLPLAFRLVGGREGGRDAGGREDELVLEDRGECTSRSCWVYSVTLTESSVRSLHAEGRLGDEKSSPVWWKHQSELELPSLPRLLRSTARPVAQEEERLIVGIPVCP